MATVQFCFPNELTIYEVANVYAELQIFLTASDALFLDLSNVEEIDSSGIQLVLRTLLHIDKEGLSLKEFKVSEIVEKKFSMLRISLPSPTEIGG